jgi:hypothetical protein
MLIKVSFFPKHFIAMPTPELLTAELLDSVRNAFSPAKLGANLWHHKSNV